MKELTELIERILKLLSLITLLITAIGFVHLIWFYHQYSIPISSYINLSEILLYSLGNVGIFIVSFLIPVSFILYVLIVRIKSKDWKLQELNHRIIEFAFILFAIIAYLSLIIFQDLIGETAFKFSNICYMLLLFLTASNNNLDLEIPKQKKLFKVLFIISTIIGIGSAVVMLFSSLKGNRESQNNEHHIVFLKLDDSTAIRSSDSIRYLGKTDGYYFLYNKKRKESLIYPSSRIKQISIIDTLIAKE